jgi:hypothetical protein
MTLSKNAKIVYGVIGGVVITSLGLTVTMQSDEDSCDKELRTHKSQMRELSEESQKILQDRKLLSTEYKKTQDNGRTVITVTECKIENGSATLSKHAHPDPSLGN